MSSDENINWDEPNEPMDQSRHGAPKQKAGGTYWFQIKSESLIPDVDNPVSTWAGFVWSATGDEDLLRRPKTSAIKV